MSETLSSLERRSAIANLAGELGPTVIDWRRSIHQNPELAFSEHETAALIESHLRTLGLDPRTGIGGTGLTVMIRSDREERGPTIALRADMDALPVEEQTGLPFASSKRVDHEGTTVPVMHACGHDAHVAILMGVASLLSKLRSELRHDVKLIFQPAEEIVDDGKNGAERMVEEGVLEGVGQIYGLHVTQALPSGVVGLRPGVTMASVDELEVEVIGRQTHGAYPWKGVDPIVVASQIVLALQTIPSRQIDLSTSPAVITIGSFHGGVRSNIIPDRVRLRGTIRTLDESVRERTHALLDRTIRGIAESAGARAEVNIRRGYPVTRNDPDTTAACRKTLAGAIGDDRVVEIPPVFGGEDMSFFLERAPGTFFFLGVRPTDVAAADAIPNHSPLFDVDENALVTGVIALASLAFQ